jgi:predicted RNA binding protein YcfA (HicA-like mRNA interferase family)
MSTKPISLRDARKLLKGAGFEMTRRRGKHEVWGHPDGRSVSLPHTPERDGLHGYLAHKVRTYARGERLTYQKVGLRQ